MSPERKAHMGKRPERKRLGQVKSRTRLKQGKLQTDRPESKGSLSENRELLKKDIYVSRVKRRVPAGLPPLLFTILMVLAIFWLLPLLFSRPESKPEDGNPAVDAIGGEAGGTQIKKGDLLYVRAGEAPLYELPDSEALRLCSVLYGERVEALNGAQEGRVRVRLQDGSEGWVPAEDLAFPAEMSGRAIRKQGLVLTSLKRVMSHAMSGHLLFEAPMGSLLDIDYVSRDVLRLRLGDGSPAWISPDGIKVLNPGAAIPLPEDAARLFASSAMNFYGVRVVPGGCSRYGADMAGVIYISARVNGLELPRELAGQAALGEEIKQITDSSTGLPRIALFETGDVLFFHDGFDKSKPVYAALLLEQGQALCRLSNDSTLEIRELEREPELLRRLMTVRRYFPASAAQP